MKVNRYLCVQIEEALFSFELKHDLSSNNNKISFN